MNRKHLLFTLAGLLVLGLLFSVVLLQRTEQQIEQKDENAVVHATQTAVEEAREKVGSAPAFSLQVPAGYQIGVFAEDLGKVRDLQFSPGGTLLASIPDRDVVVALPDRDRDGRADEVKEVVRTADRPHGLAFFNRKLFVASERQVARYNYNEQNMSDVLGKVLFELPAGGNHPHRTLAIDSNGRLFVSVGSTCNVCREANPFSGTVIVSDVDGAVAPRIFSAGLRNAPFLTFQPKSNLLWSTGMGRDHLGDTLPPDEINILREDQHYGWPSCYGNRVPDRNFNPNANCERTVPPVFELPAHVAPLGLAFIESAQFPADQQGDLLVALHGSWNSTTPVGYKIVRLSVDGETVSKSQDFITGFLNSDTVHGRPVDVAFDQNGSLYISDDEAGAVYKVSKR